MIVVVFLVSFSEIEFSCFQKYVEFFMTSFFRYVFVFGSVCVEPRVFGIMQDRKLVKACLMLTILLSPVFLRLKFSFFQKHVEVLYENQSL